MEYKTKILLSKPKEKILFFYAIFSFFTLLMNSNQNQVALDTILFVGTYNQPGSGMDWVGGSRGIGIHSLKLDSQGKLQKLATYGNETTGCNPSYLTLSNSKQTLYAL
jgi:hypothetical protein